MASKKSRSKNTSASTKSLKSGRPPLLLPSSSSGGGKVLGVGGPSSTSTTTTAQRTSSISSRHTRTVIRRHHTLQKRLSRARAAGDLGLARQLELELEASGGLATYQLASTVGQSAERGGDSSRVLVQWIKDELDVRRKSRPRQQRNQKDQDRNSSTTFVIAGDDDDQTRPKKQKASPPPPPPPLRILEIGALSTTNALNVVDATQVRRIDLRSSASGIEEIDFMKFPLPNDPTGKGSWKNQKGYDVLSLSLVLNYVPDAHGRGEMLKRTTLFFTDSTSDSSTSTSAPALENKDRNQDVPDDENVNGLVDLDDLDTTTSGSKSLPCLFLVLPAPTIHNSRYLTPSHLDLIMSSLGYTARKTKTTQKLHYSLWTYDPTEKDRWVREGGQTVFPKKEINPGAGRNNFCIIID
ncbi:25S rRNA (adenine2142-N1)-methyltransferase [Exophiala oligosperma]